MAPKHRVPRSELLSEATNAFPSNRYFQLHFEHLQQRLEELGQQLEATREALAQVHAHLGIETEPSDPRPARRRRRPKSTPALPLESPAPCWSASSGEG